jgi:deoxyribodipyrimidine photo-lyase
MPDLVWFRQDLRIIDQPALEAALAQGPALALFVVSMPQWGWHPEAPTKIELWRRLLIDLQPRLTRIGVALKVLRVDEYAQLPEALLAFCQAHGVKRVHCNRELGWYERMRDRYCYKVLRDHQIDLIGYDGNTLLAPGSVKTGNGDTYRVFSPFARACRRILADNPPVLDSAFPQFRGSLAAVPDDIESVWHERLPSLREYWTSDYDAILAALQEFASNRIRQYDSARDYPQKPGTSQLSAYLACGALSVKQCLHIALQANNGEIDSGNAGIRSWINELIWREFYWHLLHGYPKLSKHQPLKEETAAVAWRDAPQDFQAWCEGRTGIPIVDAAMRQLVTTGWMHNRLRMIAAMFLTKNLLIDWRLGERFFMEHLIDGELAANNGGWQWSASTGADAAPYFRVFNPVSQSQRFDPDGGFIRQWLPELALLDPKSIHEPSAQQRKECHYPEPIVDLKSSRLRAIEAFKRIS